ncbi:hypothetical protein [Rhizobium sp.]|uniref:hypothetical protein n=1 Tax=Rhizobium sp. TaxID=391 RepID=UPI0028A97ADB
MSATTSYRLPMPITDVDQPIAAAYLNEALAELVSRTKWFLGTRSNAELIERYEDLAVYLWLDHTEDPGVFTAHMELATAEHARMHYPADAVKTDFDGNWRLGDVLKAINTDGWLAQFMVSGVQRFLELTTTGSAH